MWEKAIFQARLEEGYRWIFEANGSNQRNQTNWKVELVGWKSWLASRKDGLEVKNKELHEICWRNVQPEQAGPEAKTKSWRIDSEKGAIW